MARQAVFHPPLGRDGVKIADDLRIADGVTGRRDPDVLADAVLAPRAEQVADDLAVLDRRRARRVLPRLLDLFAEVRRTRQQPFDREMGRVSFGQDGGGSVHVVVGEGDDVHGP